MIEEGAERLFTSQQLGNMEVVVIVHAARTTTSEAETRLGIITVSKQKLTTHENPDRKRKV